MGRKKRTSLSVDDAIDIAMADLTKVEAYIDSGFPSEEYLPFINNAIACLRVAFEDTQKDDDRLAKYREQLRTASIRAGDLHAEIKGLKNKVDQIQGFAEFKLHKQSVKHKIELDKKGAIIAKLKEEIPYIKANRCAALASRKTLKILRRGQK